MSAPSATTRDKEIATLKTKLASCRSQLADAQAALRETPLAESAAAAKKANARAEALEAELAEQRLQSKVLERAAVDAALDKARIESEERAAELRQQLAAARGGAEDARATCAELQAKLAASSEREETALRDLAVARQQREAAEESASSAEATQRDARVAAHDAEKALARRAEAAEAAAARAHAAEAEAVREADALSRRAEAAESEARRARAEAEAYAREVEAAVAGQRRAEAAAETRSQEAAAAAASQRRAEALAETRAQEVAAAAASQRRAEALAKEASLEMDARDASRERALRETEERLSNEEAAHAATRREFEAERLSRGGADEVVVGDTAEVEDRYQRALRRERLGAEMVRKLQDALKAEQLRGETAAELVAAQQAAEADTMASLRGELLRMADAESAARRELDAMAASARAAEAISSSREVAAAHEAAAAAREVQQLSQRLEEAARGELSARREAHEAVAALGRMRGEATTEAESLRRQVTHLEAELVQGRRALSNATLAIEAEQRAARAARAQLAAAATVATLPAGPQTPARPSNTGLLVSWETPAGAGIQEATSSAAFHVVAGGDVTQPPPLAAPTRTATVPSSTPVRPSAEEAVEAWARLDYEAPTSAPRSPPRATTTTTTTPSAAAAAASPRSHSSPSRSTRQCATAKPRTPVRTRGEQDDAGGANSGEAAALEESRAAAVRRVKAEAVRARAAEEAAERKELRAELEKLKVASNRHARAATGLRERLAEGKRHLEERERELERVREQLRNETGKRHASEAAKRSVEGTVALAKRRERELDERVAVDAGKLERLQKQCEALTVKLRRTEAKDKKTEAKLRAEQSLNMEPSWVREMRTQLKTVQARRNAKRIAASSPGLGGWSDGIASPELGGGPPAMPDALGELELKRIAASQEAYIHELENHVAELEDELRGASRPRGWHADATSSLPSGVDRLTGADRFEDAERLFESLTESEPETPEDTLASREPLSQAYYYGEGSVNCTTPARRSGQPSRRDQPSAPREEVPWLGSSVRRALKGAAPPSPAPGADNPIAQRRGTLSSLSAKRRTPSLLSSKPGQSAK